MEGRSYEIKYYFQGPNDTIIQEIKYLDVPSDTPKPKKYQWFMIKKPFPPLPMTFLSRNCNMRIFKEGCLIVHPKYAIFNGEIWDLSMPTLSIVQTPDYYFHGKYLVV